MRALRAKILALSLALPLLGMAAHAAPPRAPFVVVVHPNNRTDGVSRKFLADAFLKKTTRWEHGEALRPVDQRVDAPVRAAFSEKVLKRSVAAVRNYWQQMVFSGRDVPPPELSGDAEVLSYVNRHSGAVGYVSGTADVGKAKVLAVH